MYVVSNLEKCGPINVLYNIVREVNKSNTCQIVTLSPENKKSMLKDFENLNIRIIHMDLDREEKKYFYIKTLDKIIQEFQPIIIHTHGYRSDRYINMLKSHSFKHVTTLHNFPLSDYPKLYGIIRGTLLAFAHMFTIIKINYKIACSYSIADKFKKINVRGIITIQNGVDVDIYKPLSKSEQTKIRNKLGLPLNKEIVISTGAIIKRKRPIKLIEAFSKYIEKDETLFLVLGDGPLFSKINQYNSRNIILLGSVENVVDYLQASDVFISNSKAEGLPMAMLEAASTGLKIVGSDISPHREVKQFYSSKIILYKGQNTRKIITSIKRSITSDNNVIEEKKRTFKLSSYCMSKKYMEYYRDMKVK